MTTNALRATVRAGGLAAASLALGSSCGIDSAVRARAFRAATAPSEALQNGPRLTGSRRRAALGIDCSAPAIRISPLVYGIASYARHDDENPQQWRLGATIRRWGGNSTSRYNWMLGNAWNAAADWYWENTDYETKPGWSYKTFLADDLSHGMKTALTVPMIGWVAKDTTSYSYAVSAFGAQDAVDPHKPDAGNGQRAKKLLAPPTPTRTSVPAPPELIRRWVEAIRAEDARTGVRSVHQYILDNEPNLWNSTHHDVHPEPLGYDELLDRTLQYGAAIRAADPDAVIAGPAEWGWLNYFYSSQDLASGFGTSGVGFRPDRLRHGNMPLVAWYLEKLREHEQKTGVRVLDVLDLHFYPAAAHVYSPDDSSEVAALRIRATRALWDPTYVDESWINEPIMLLPRMKQWVADNYPGRGISIGEWNFGGEKHMSGGLAVAEVLGRFGQNQVSSAFYWTYPPDGSPAYWAFRAYRNFDGHGGRFLDWSVPARASEGTSIFASRDDTGSHLVAVVLNFSPDTVVDAAIDLHTCGAVAKVAKLTYTQGLTGLAPGSASEIGGALAAELPPYSINVIDVKMENGG
jgi:hypothetical protein